MNNYWVAENEKEYVIGKGNDEIIHIPFNGNKPAAQNMAHYLALHMNTDSPDMNMYLISHDYQDNSDSGVFYMTRENTVSFGIMPNELGRFLFSKEEAEAIILKKNAYPSNRWKIEKIKI